MLFQKCFVLAYRALESFYRQFLFDGILPFWLEHGIDSAHGGLLTCMDEQGHRLSTDKFIWSQGRGIWTFAAMHRRLQADSELLQIAAHTAEFCLRHAMLPDGRVAFRVSQGGEVLEGSTSIYADLFLAYGLNELYLATGMGRYRETALKLFKQSVREIRQPYFNKIAPYALPERVAWVHGPPMIALEVANELLESVSDPEVEEFVDWALERIMRRHRRPDMRVVLEHLGPDDEFIDSPSGRAVVPGHALESMWFVIHASLRRKRPELVVEAVEMIRWMVESGWDAEYGGIFLGLDAHGKSPPWFANAEKKLWWVHCEALYALLLCRHLTGAAWCEEWLERVRDWSFRHHGDGSTEWVQRLDRIGKPVTELIALPVKDPFHLPRSLILSIQLLSNKHPYVR